MNLEIAKTYIRSLNDRGLMYHFDDDAEDCLRNALPENEAQDVQKAVNAIYEANLDWSNDGGCPIGYALKILNEKESSEKSINEKIQEAGELLVKHLNFTEKEYADDNCETSNRILEILEQLGWLFEDDEQFTKWALGASQDEILLEAAERARSATGFDICEVLYDKAFSNALAMMEGTDLEPTSAFKQAGSDLGIPFGTFMGRFVEEHCRKRYG